MEEFIHFNLFYVFLFAFLIIVVTAICRTVRYMNGNKTNKGVIESIKDMFCKSSDNAKEITLDNNKVHMDTTGKMKGMHDNVVKVDFTDKHEQELDEIEQTIDTHSTQLEQLTLKVEQIDVKVDELLNQFIEIRKQNKI